MNLVIRAGDVELAVTIMREVAWWCIEVGKPMWNPRELTKEKLLRKPRNADSFLVGWCGGQAAACMILQWHDPTFWPEVKADKSAFIHKLCVRREFAGRNFSVDMVGHAVNECIKKGIEHVRLDTDLTNPRLCALYEGMGFVRTRRTAMNGRDYALYTLRVAGFEPSWQRMKVM